MKKKFITLLLCAAVGIGALSGCGGNTSAKELPEDSVAADITVDKESLPPLSEDLQEIYEGAYKIYYQISFGAFDYDENATYEKDELTYYKITDPRFPTYEDFRTYLLQYFTEFFVDNSILSKEEEINAMKAEFDAPGHKPDIDVEIGDFDDIVTSTEDEGRDEDKD